MDPTVAVLVTYHDEGELLRECLASLRAQTELPDEIWVYDDASSSPAQDYLLEGVPVQLMRAPRNRGPFYGRNMLLDRSRSTYVHFHDCDDWFFPEWCQRVRSAILTSDADVVVTEVQASDGRQVTHERLLGVDWLVGNADLVRFCLRGGVPPLATTIRRETARLAGPWTGALRQSEDYYYHVRLAAAAASYVAIQEPLVAKRNRGGSHSHDLVAVWTEAVRAIEMLSTELPSRYRPDLADAAARAGGHLFKLGARTEARRAFGVALQLGPPSFAAARRLYRTVARTFGPMTAEYLGAAYRGLPRTWREYLASRGW